MSFDNEESGRKNYSISESFIGSTYSADLSGGNLGRRYYDGEE
jgi:hypothetical protein